VIGGEGFDDGHRCTTGFGLVNATGACSLSALLSVDSGGTSMRDRARAVIDEILAEEPRLALPPDIAKQVTAIANRAVADQTG
jgi:hypothetical protein